jgi:D-lyxose ketol-isomerase
MKPSEINRLIEDAQALLHRHHIKLPPFAYGSPKDVKVGRFPKREEDVPPVHLLCTEY